jgi:aspartate kinase
MKSDKLLVQKYGGVTLATPEKIKKVAKHCVDLVQSHHQLVVVVSAMGSSTNDLIHLAHQVSPHPDPRELDMLISTGERVSMALLCMAIIDQQCSAISFTGSQAGIITDQRHFNANIIDVQPQRVQAALSQNQVVVLAGFQGVSQVSKEITTLGRGGSDTTAVAMAAALNSTRCEILKDVSGVYTADPHLIPEAQEISELNFDQLIEMTKHGAKMVHYRAAEMAKEKNITLTIKSAATASTQGRGTLVHTNADPKKSKSSINCEKNWVTLTTPNPMTQSQIQLSQQVLKDLRITPKNQLIEKHSLSFELPTQATKEVIKAFHDQFVE